MSVSMTSHCDVAPAAPARNLRTLRFDHMIRPVMRTADIVSHEYLLKLEMNLQVAMRLVDRDSTKNARMNG